MTKPVQARVLAIPAPADDPVTVELGLADALAVGHSLRMLARQQKTPRGTADVYARVGAQIVAAAHRQIAESGKGGR